MLNVETFFFSCFFYTSIFRTHRHLKLFTLEVSIFKASVRRIFHSYAATSDMRPQLHTNSKWTFCPLSQLNTDILGSITIQDWRSGLHHNSRLTLAAPSQLNTDVGALGELTNIWWWNGFCFKGKQWITPGIGVDMPWSMKPTNTLSLLSQHCYDFTEHGRAGEGWRHAKTTCVVTASVHVGCQDVDMRKQDHRVVSN